MNRSATMLNLRPIVHAILEDYALPWHGTHGVGHGARVLENGLRLAEQMNRRLKTLRPSPTVMPLWAWSQWDGPRRRKPDLRAVRFWHPKGERAIRVECQVQDERVLLSDYELWHYVLNYWYLPKTQAAGDAFDKKLDAAGLSTCRFTHDNPLPDAYRQEVETSWQRIFDLEWVDPDVTHTPETKSIQATVWELLLEDVVDATEFAGASMLGGK